MESMMETRNIKIKFVERPDYRVYPATGVWGGVNTSGVVLVDFFLEKKSKPVELNIEVCGPQVKELSRQGEEMIREIQFGVMLQPHVAFSIGKWLIQKAKELGIQDAQEMATQGDHEDKPIH
jgi:hypothetical protein